jgi:hypothetical protein
VKRAIAPSLGVAGKMVFTSWLEIFAPFTTPAAVVTRLTGWDLLDMSEVAFFFI